ncbi:hypothetical protein NI454_09055 [Brevundimonas diminuta]|uniref:hypothetical protein n=1 Tax=Brevundimonas diminuta TaxID=293 RepID=UPI0020971434|nr:hypothetical protein [Brevundimonas diminuta]MCO8030098.1 hypothetical protein [Brevundimonas diminuta]
MIAAALFPYALPLRREGDAAIVDKTGETLLVVAPDRHLENDEDAARLADLVFARLTAAPVREEAPAETGEWITGNALHEIMASFDGQADVSEIATKINAAIALRAQPQAREDAQPVAVTIFCPECSLPHVDEGEWATTRHHKTHQCQGCGHEWRPFPFATVGVPHPTSSPAPEAEKLRSALADLASWFTKPVQGERGLVWVIPAGERGADDAVSEALAALQQDALSAAPGEANG